MNAAKPPGTGVVVRHVFGMESLAVVLGNETGVELARHKLRVRQQRRLERNVADAADPQSQFSTRAS